MADLKQVTYCGLYCGLCAQCTRIPKQAGVLFNTMKKEGWEFWGKELPKFEEFWGFLDRLANSEGKCSCREGKCGPPFCEIRKCAQEKKIDTCPLCEEYPCQRFEGLAKVYVNLIADGKRMKEIGIDQWIKEQEARKATGFAYSDIRCYPSDVKDIQ